MGNVPKHLVSDTYPRCARSRLQLLSGQEERLSADTGHNARHQRSVPGLHRGWRHLHCAPATQGEWPTTYPAHTCHRHSPQRRRLPIGLHGRKGIPLRHRQTSYALHRSRHAERRNGNRAGA